MLHCLEYIWQFNLNWTKHIFVKMCSANHYAQFQTNPEVKSQKNNYYFVTERRFFRYLHLTWVFIFLKLLTFTLHLLTQNLSFLLLSFSKQDGYFPFWLCSGHVPNPKCWFSLMTFWEEAPQSTICICVHYIFTFFSAFFSSFGTTLPQVQNICIPPYNWGLGAMWSSKNSKYVAYA